MIFFTPKRHQNFNRINTPRSGDCQVVETTDAWIKGVHGARAVLMQLLKNYGAALKFK